MKVSVITLFPQWIEAYCGLSILGRAQKAGVAEIFGVNPRDFTEDKYQKVDDAPYGGGVGMVMMCEPLIKAYESLPVTGAKRKVLMMSPAGKPFSQSMAQDWAQNAEELVFFCGHYEGIDARLFDLIPELEPVSLGDFVMTGGELAALAMIDATVRLLPGALGKDASVEDESFSAGLLEYPQYTRPAVFRGIPVPEVLTSGDHGAIARWREAESRRVTGEIRPDLLTTDSNFIEAYNKYLTTLISTIPKTLDDSSASPKAAMLYLAHAACSYGQAIAVVENTSTTAAQALNRCLAEITLDALSISFLDNEREELVQKYFTDGKLNKLNEALEILLYVPPLKSQKLQQHLKYTKKLGDEFLNLIDPKVRNTVRDALKKSTKSPTEWAQNIYDRTWKLIKRDKFHLKLEKLEKHFETYPNADDLTKSLISTFRSSYNIFGNSSVHSDWATHAEIFSSSEEDSKLEFNCYLALWQLGWVQNALLNLKIISVEQDEQLQELHQKALDLRKQIF